MTQLDDIAFYNELAAAKTIFLPLRKEITNGRKKNR